MFRCPGVSVTRTAPQPALLPAQNHAIWYFSIYLVPMHFGCDGAPKFLAFPSLEMCSPKAASLVFQSGIGMQQLRAELPPNLAVFPGTWGRDGCPATQVHPQTLVHRHGASSSRIGLIPFQGRDLVFTRAPAAEARGCPVCLTVS